MKIIVISNSSAAANEAAIINGLFDAGLNSLHLRKPDYSSAQLRRLISLIKEDYHPFTALHQHHEIAPEFGITRLHYTEQAYSATPAVLLQKQKDQGYTLSTSLHQLDTLGTLNVFDYVFYGPVFNSLSKPGYQSKLPPGFRLAHKPPGPKVIALGGISMENLPQVMKMNFDGAAILGAIWNMPEQGIENFKQINND
jgi:thiamine-phosphate pyrophosphorylase